MNQLNPYPLVDTDMGYEFFTDGNYHYSVYFNQNTNYFDDKDVNTLVYDFGFYCSHDIETHVHDSRIVHTLISCINNFFSSNSTGIIAFTCDAKDSYELYRFRLFNIWHIKYFKHYCEKIDYKTLIEDSWLCISIILQQDNPLVSLVKESFKEEEKETA